MPTADWDTLEPTVGDPGNAFEYGLDVQIGAAFVNVPDITALNPAPQPQQRNRSTYAAKGVPKPQTYARGMQVTFNVEVVRDALGQYQEELQYLLDKSFMLMSDNIVRVRIFDTLGADYAFEADYTIEHNRPSTGDTDAGFFGFTLTATSTPVKIANPAEDVSPGIIRATPSGAGENDVVTLHGRNFTGATGVTIGGTAGTNVSVIDDRTLQVTLPAGAAGSAPIVVTSPAGSSTALPYTRAA